MKRLIGALVMVGVLVAPAVSEAWPKQLKPSERIEALGVARDYWANHGRYADYRGCNRVRTKIGWRDPDTGRSMNESGLLAYWAPWDHCRLVFNGYADWSDGGKRDPWWLLCAVTVHEYGHLVGWGSRTGRKHSHSNPKSIMAPGADIWARSWWWPAFPACLT